MTSRKRPAGKGRRVPNFAAMHLFTARLPILMDEAMRLGMFRTVHALHGAVRVAGYELAALTSTSPTPRKRRKP